MSHLDEILAKLGWENGFQIPVANAENQALEEEVARLTLQKIRAKTACETSALKLENLDGHLRYIKQENEENQKLLTAYIQQLQSEEDKYRLIVGEREKIDQEIRKFGKETGDVEGRQEIKRATLQKSIVKIEKLKSETNWDTEALKAWEDSLKKRDDNNELIKKFSKEDERKYNELEAKRQNLELEYSARKDSVAKMVCDLTNYERVLERTGKVMKEQIAERDALVKQWKDSVKILHQRDSDIDAVQNQVMETNALVEHQQEKLEEQLDFYRNEVRNNEELDFETYQLNQVNSRKRRELIELTQLILLLSSEADTLRRMMTTTAKTLEKKRGERKFITLEIEKKEKRIERYQKELVKLRAKSEEISKSSATAAERAKHLEKMIEFEEKQYRILASQGQWIQNASFKIFQELQEQQNIGKMKETIIGGLTTRISHMRKYNKDSKKNVDKQREAVYEMDHRIEEIQRRITKMEEEVYTGDDEEELEAKFKELEQKFNEFNEIKLLLQEQVNRIEDDRRRLASAIAADQAQLTANKNKLQDRMLNFEGGQKQLVTLRHHLQERQVEENILRLRVNQIENEMKKEQKTIFSLQRFRLKLEHAVSERLIEINTSRDVLLAKRRNLNEDKSRLKCDLAERQIRLEQFRKKYDIVIMTMGTDSEGNRVSITHFKIKNAQEKFLLQKEGDELDNKIQKAEREIVAMENTLKVVNVTNYAFKKSLGAVDDDSAEMIEMKMLNNEILKTNDLLREHRKNYNKKKEELEEIKKNLGEIENKYETEEEQLQKLEQDYYTVLKSKADSEEKIQRTKRCLKSVGKKIKHENVHNYDRDLEIRQLKEANNNVLNKLSQMSQSYPEVTPLINRYSLEYDVKLPERRSSTSSFYTVSCRGDETSSSSSAKKSLKEPTKSESTSRSSSSRTSARSSGSSVHKVTLTFNI